MKIRLTRKQVKTAQRLPGLGLMVPVDLPRGDLTEDEGRPTTDEEHAMALAMLDIAHLRDEHLLVRGTKVVYVRRPYNIASWPGELRVHFAYDVADERFYGAAKRPPPHVRWI